MDIYCQAKNTYLDRDVEILNIHGEGFRLVVKIRT
jgi:hypothetical protein